nr:MAG TPA: hypothetical protein [Caudoviricetes sp.]
MFFFVAIGRFPVHIVTDAFNISDRCRDTFFGRPFDFSVKSFRYHFSGSSFRQVVFVSEDYI